MRQKKRGVIFLDKNHKKNKSSYREQKRKEEKYGKIYYGIGCRNHQQPLYSF